ncbi:hypothetical protein TBLA_0C03530 [Henningerozyma blattae CBS 6284]|uniref:MaoC-like domain-containing protein n=1 Tax=Henningerozyma blattae (strain ATCC 34711 / CBS 6284 / DSM 70876 / NBRC 10599 / NRRL Y-10934 / UCD 77-7) TaxID=1071380 RepID=I2H1A3_HENB6|nr:hypothetical protein TBLA_0C03530 [Tetrapisispora blattae CBS 6284]CCH60155.1 hypothetical protein TBLA_0C03530 [Tetrapisispora blattae CBS 6284]
MSKVSELIFKDYLTRDKLIQFRKILLSKNLKSSLAANLSDQLLICNPFAEEKDKDGYFKYQTPSNILKNNSLLYKRRLWGQGEIRKYNELKINEAYKCNEKLKYIKKFKDEYHVCMERVIISDAKADTLISRELRTLVYKISKYSRSTMAANQTPLIGEIINKNFAFNDLDIIQYSQLTSNPHRIHWDKSYTQDIEGYETIIVQGPFLLQTLASTVSAYLGINISSIKYKNHNILYQDIPIEIVYHKSPSVPDGPVEAHIRSAKDPSFVYLSALITTKP